MGTHTRVGSQSPLRVLTGHLVELIWGFVQPLERQVPAPFLKGRSFLVQPCCATTGQGVREGMLWMDERLTENKGALLACCTREAGATNSVDPLLSSWDGLYKASDQSGCIDARRPALVPSVKVDFPPPVK